MAFQYAEIPLTNSPVNFGIVLSGVRYELTFVYRDTTAAGGCGWTVDIADTYGAPIVCGIPLVIGADLLAQYEYLALGGIMLVATDGDAHGARVPTFANLGTGSHVYWVTET
jgi:hypothetical protein